MADSNSVLETIFRYAFSGDFVSGLQALITQAYEQAKAGNWENLRADWKDCQILARRCSRFQKEGSGWTFLHQAAYFGNELACLDLIALGADAGIVTSQGKTAAEISAERGYPALAARLQRARLDCESLWIPSTDPDLRPSSNMWQEAAERWSTELILVAYAGGVVKIPKETKYYVDSLERILVGWHGSFNPPCDMDGQTLIPGRS